MKHIPAEAALCELRERLGRGEVSALIGAGFSKNVYLSYPDWKQLLNDMTIEMYGNDINRGLTTVDDVVAKEGYLGIVSKYIERKGIREAIEDYIEQRIPRVNESTYVLQHNGTAMPLTDDDFAIHLKLLEGGWDTICTTNYDKLLELTSKRYGKSWKTVERSQDLIFSQHVPTIVKLHGTLADEDDENFEFDNDFHKRYIIAKEDYKSYPQKHEAFTQLMRLLLLRGTFCLFGFSGDDPNFISWVDWVRDILVMRRDLDTDNPCHEIRIFLFGVGKVKPSAEKYKFFNNHKIHYVHLMDDEVQQVIMGDERSEDVKVVLSAMLDFLYTKVKAESYSDLWSNAYNKYDGGKMSEVTVNSEYLNKIKEVHAEHRINANVRYQLNYIDCMRSKKLLTEDDIELLLLAFEDTFLMGENVPELAEKIENSNMTDAQRARWNHLLMRGETMSLPFNPLNGDEECVVYERVLRYAFMFRFKELKHELDLWKPSGVYVIKKAVFCSFFHKHNAKSILLEYIDQETNQVNCSLASDILGYIMTELGQYNTDTYRNQGIPSLRDLTRQFLDQTVTEGEVKQPFGKHVKSIVIGGRTGMKVEFFRCLMFLIETPHRVSYNLYSALSKQNAYRIMHEMYENYPWPVMFYTMQIGERDVVTRIAQEFAYSESLHWLLPNLLECLLDFILSDYYYWKISKNAYIFATELFVAVEPKRWEARFMDLWERYTEKANPTERTDTEERNILNKGCCYIRSIKCKRKILMDCLTSDKMPLDDVIGFLYDLREEQRMVDETVEGLLDAYIDNIQDYRQFNVLGNIYKILNKKQIDKAAKRFGEMYVNNHIVAHHSFNALAFITKDHPKERAMFRKAIIRSPHLWDNGLGDGYASETDIVHLSQFYKNIYWLKLEFKQLYNKLVASFNQLVASKYYITENCLLPNEYESLLKEMAWFLKHYSKELSVFDGYKNICHRVNEEYYKKVGAATIAESMLSNERDVILVGLSDLCQTIAKNGYAFVQKEVLLLTNRILLQKQEALTECIDYLQYILYRFYKKPENVPDDISSNIVQILKMYDLTLLLNLETVLPRTTKYMVKLAKFYKNAIVDTEVTSKWMKYKDSNFFNELNLNG